jgi:hypothetical protein
MSLRAGLLLACLAASEPEPIEVAESGDYVIREADPPSAFVEPRPRAVEFRVGAMLMERIETTRTRPIDGPGTTTITAPTRLRAQLEARTDHVRALAQIQDARVLGDPVGPARAGFHQLYAQYETTLARGRTLVVRAGRQEFSLANHHLFANAPWTAGQRSWDALFLGITGARAGLSVFGGSLARPLASAGQPLIDHVRSEIAIAWVIESYIALLDALVIDGVVWGDHRSDASGDRNVVTSGVRLHGSLAPGLRYEAEGELQLGLIQRLDLVQRHVAGHAFATLDYTSQRELGSVHAKPGAFVLFDFASGSKCTTASYTALEPCTDGTSHDWDAAWMDQHRWFGQADRFRAQNVIDAAAGVRVTTRPSRALELALELSNHVFAFPQPAGRWHDANGGLVGVALANRSPWAADEIDLVVGLTRGWLSFDLGWMIVANLAGGRALSHEALRQFVYARATIELWSPWR